MKIKDAYKNKKTTSGRSRRERGPWLSPLQTKNIIFSHV